MGETINIFDKTPLRMKISFLLSGYYNFEPNCVYEKKTDICVMKSMMNTIVWYITFSMWTEGLKAFMCKMAN